MLKSLYIQNYRCLDSLRIDPLKRVNLITGKNNTGKSSVLEAMVIYASRGSVGQLFQLLESHGEYIPKSENEYDKANPFKLMTSIFTNRNIKLGKKDIIVIGDLSIEEIESAKNNRNYEFYGNNVKIQFQAILDRTIKPFLVDEKGSKINEDKLDETALRVGYQSGFSISDITFKLDSNIFKSNVTKYPYSDINHQFVKTSQIDRDENGALFDKLALTDNEKHVVEALKIIEPNVERIAFVQSDSTSKYRYPVIRLKGVEETVPLRSMGDGINRVLTIILALIHSQDGYLMIDEFENGLHYSVQKKLWEIIFKLSKELNVQVFATTHSNDSIRSMRNALSELPEDEREDAVAIKLMRAQDDKLEALVYDFEQLDYVIDQDIDIR